MEKIFFGTTPGTPGTPPLRSTSREIITLHGIGGAGKSQICAKYAHKYAGAYTAIFWITATTVDEVRRTALGAVDQIISHYTTNLPNHGPSNLQRAALALGFDEPSIEDPEELRAAVEERSAIEVLKHWLSKEFNDRWLLIIDDYSIPRDSDYNLDGILPTNDVGHVIVTTQEPGLTDHNHIRIPESIGKNAGVSLLKALGCPNEQEWDGLLIPTLYLLLFRVADKTRLMRKRRRRDSKYSRWIPTRSPTCRVVRAQVFIRAMCARVKGQPRLSIYISTQ